MTSLSPRPVLGCVSLLEQRQAVKAFSGSFKTIGGPETPAAGSQSCGKRFHQVSDPEEKLLNSEISVK
jgi:hypothetical protein